MISPFETIKDLRKKIKAKEILPSEIITFYTNRLKKYNPVLNTCISTFENNIPTPSPEGKLAGIPCLIKDNICIRGEITTAGSKILENFRPSYNATVVSNIKNQGGIILGKGNMDEFAMGSSGEFSAFGQAKNPWNLEYSPGGSSSGISAAVAAGLVPWGVGTETGGSVRQPAAFCGLVGLFPTYGLLSRFGLLAFGSSLDQPGPITRTVYDSAIALSVLSGHDSKDSTSLPEPKFDYTKGLTGKLPKDLKIGIIKDTFSQSVDPELKSAVENTAKTLEALGAKVKIINLETLKYGIAVYFVLSRAEAASNLSRIDGTLYGKRSTNFKDLEDMYIKTRDTGFGAEVKRRILLGNYVLASEHRDVFAKANYVRNLIRAELENVFEDVDLLLSPTNTTPAFKLGELIDDPIALYLGDLFVLPNCVAGYPAISIPTGLSKKGLPLGVQFIGPKLSEELLLSVSYACEQNQNQLLFPEAFRD